MKNHRCRTCASPLVARRAFVSVGSLGFLGITLEQFLRARHAAAAEKSAPAASGSGKAQSCIFLWLEGGPSQMETWDPKPSGQFRPLPTNVPGIQLSELLPRVARKMDKLSLVRTMYTEENNHPQAAYYAMTGHRPNPAMEFPSFGSIIAKEKGERNHVPAHVMVPPCMGYHQSAFLGAAYDSLVVPDPSKKDFALPDLALPKSVTVERLEDRRGLLELIDQQYRAKAGMVERAATDTFTEQAQSMILSPAVRAAFDMSAEPDRVKEAYGRTGFGQSALLARRLVEAGSRFVTAAGFTGGPWDTHSDNDSSHRDKLVPVLDQALSALVTDLDQRGLLASTVVLVLGEFGRTPYHNSRNGRDHWSACWSMALGGGGLRGGTVVGASDEKGAYLASGRKVTIGDLYATVYRALGIDWKTEYMHPIGRPVKIANSEDDQTGEPVAELFG